MSKMRSPNYPAIGLSEALEAARKLWSQEKRTTVDIGTIATAWGYSSVSGRVRSKLGALRKYGLVEDTSTGTRISDLGVRILHGIPDSSDYVAAIRESALFPGLFRELFETHRDASDQAIRSHLIVKKGFGDIGAREAIKAFRETISTAILDTLSYTPPSVAVEGEADAEEPESAPSTVVRYSAVSPVSVAEKTGTSMSFRWLVGNGVMADVKLFGGEVKPAHLDMLAKQLELTKAALEMDIDIQV
jgi:hypothetical protein